MTPRADQAARAAALRAAGATHADVAAELGISKAYARDLHYDPDGSKLRARKARLAGRCGCGAPTSGTRSGARRPAGRCPACARAAAKVWTADAIVAVFREFGEKHGRPPAATDALLPETLERNHGCSPERRAELEAVRAAGPRLPSAAIVRREFGSWAAAVEAAGMTPLRAGTGAHRAPARHGRGGLAGRLLVLLADGSPRRALDLLDEADQNGTPYRRRYGYTVLRRLVRAGLLERVGRGVYRLAEKAPAGSLEARSRHPATRRDDLPARVA